MANVIKKLILAPRLLYYKARAGSGRDYGKQWDSYWGSINQTGEGGEVLWDTEDLVEMQESFDAFGKSMDLSLPMLDLGCGNGRRSNFLAQRVSRVLGIDVAEAAIALARREWEGVENLEFRVANAVEQSTAAAIHEELGDMNIYMRGVFHVIQPADRPSFASNLATLLGKEGTLYQIETDGAFIDYMLQRPDATPTGLPRLVHKLVAHGILPAGFSKGDEARWFPESSWKVVDSGSTCIRTLPLPDGKAGAVPAYYVMVQTRA